MQIEVVWAGIEHCPDPTHPPWLESNSCSSPISSWQWPMGAIQSLLQTGVVAINRSEETRWALYDLAAACARRPPVFPQEGCESRCVTTLNTITAAAIVLATLNHGVVGQRRMLRRRAINDAPAASIRFLLPRPHWNCWSNAYYSFLTTAVNMIRVVSGTSSRTCLGSYLWQRIG